MVAHEGNLYIAGYFDIEIDVAWLKTNAKSVSNIKLHVDRYTMPSGRHVIILVEGPSCQLGVCLRSTDLFY